MVTFRDLKLTLAVNAAITPRRPLLIKSEPGTGKTMLAEEVAASLGLPLFEWHVKSTTQRSRGSTDTMLSRAALVVSGWKEARINGAEEWQRMLD